MNFIKRKKMAAAATAIALLLSPCAFSGTADVKWSNPEEYTDLGTRARDDTNPEHFMKEIEQSVEEVAERELPDGAVLVLDIKDVDLAGDVEPDRVDSVRVMRDVYPPRIEFSYQLVKDNEVVEEGQESVVNIDYKNDIARTFMDDHPFYYEKQLISEWIRSNFG